MQSKYPMSIFIGREVYTTFRPAMRFHEVLGAPYSYAWFCPMCGEIWARALIPGRSFSVRTAPCEKHRDPLLSKLMVPGSLYTSFDEGFQESLPEALWKRELALHINHAETVGFEEEG